MVQVIAQNYYSTSDKALLDTDLPNQNHPTTGHVLVLLLMISKSRLNILNKNCCCKPDRFTWFLLPGGCVYIHGSTLLSLLCTCSLQPPAPCSVFSLITCQNTPSWHLSSFLPLSHQGIYLTELSLVFWRSKWESESVLELTQQKTTALFQTEWVSSPALRPAVAGRMGILRAAAVPRAGGGQGHFFLWQCWLKV